ncbi:MAG: hypothetical protein ABL878_01375 [Burkholderiales bacterium]
MSPTVLDESTFDGFLSEHETVVVGFVREKSDAAQFAALTSEVQGQRPAAAFARVNADSLFDMFGLSAASTAIFRGRIGMYLEAGLPSTPRLLRLLDGVAALNMDRVYSEIEQEKAARDSLAVHRACPTNRRGKLE